MTIIIGPLFQCRPGCQESASKFAYSSHRINSLKTLGGPDRKTRYVQGTARPDTTDLLYMQRYYQAHQYTTSIIFQGHTSIVTTLHY